MRLARAGEPVLTADADEPWQFGKIRYLRRGTDICVLSYGSIVKQAIAVADGLREQGNSVSVVSVHTLKPLDTEGLRLALARHRHVIVIEEMLPNGGLSGHVKELSWDSKATCRLDVFTLKDAFLHSYGSYDEVLAAHGLSPTAILARLTGQ